MKIIKLLYIVAVCMAPVLASGQSPGGVTSGLRAWYKSDTGTGATNDGDLISTWEDQSGNALDVTASAANRRPMFYITNLTNSNFNPQVVFSGANGLRVANFMDGTEAGCSVYSSAANTNLAAGFQNLVVFGIDNPHLGKNTGTGNALAYMNGSSPISAIHPTIATSNRFHIWSWKWNMALSPSSTTSNTGLDIVFDGLVSSNPTMEVRTTSFGNGAPLTKQFSIGGYEGVEVWSGPIGEVAIYNRNLNANEDQRVSSYYSVKWGTTLRSSNATTGTYDYLSSNSTVVWNGNSNPAYHNNIFGIAKDDPSGLHQKQSKSVNTNQKLIIGAGTSLANSNAENINSLNDGQVLMVGDNNLSQILNTPFVYSSGTNGETNFRFGAVWRVQNTNNVGQVTVAWPKGISNLYLIKSTDETFNTGNTYIPMTTVVDINGTDYNTATVNLADGDFFTFAGYVHAPGGVLANLLMWHKADDGVTTPGQKNIWKDLSLNERDVFQNNNANYQPLLVTAASYSANNKVYQFNFNPFYYFDGTDDFFYNEGITYFPATNSPGSAYGVMQNSAATGFRTAYGWGNDDPNLLRDGDTYYITRNDGTALTQNVGADTLPAHIGGMNWRGATNGVYLNIDGRIYANEATNIGAIQTNINFAIGSEGLDLSGNGNEIHQGGLPEVFAYSVDHRNSAGDEYLRVNSYMAIKYGITLLNQAGTAVSNYLGSGSQVVWDTTLNAGFNNNIFGIANDFPSALNQKQSRSSNENQKLIIGSGSSLFDTNAANTNDLVDGQFLMVGDNGLKQSLNYPLVYTAGTNGETNFRFESVWKAKNTNGVGTVTIAWPKGIQNLYVVQSSDENFTSTDTFTAMDDEITVNGVEYNTATVTLADGQFFTFAGFGYAPAGVINSLSYWYRADKNAINSGVGTDVTSWTDFFSGTVSAQISTAALPKYAAGAANYFNFNPGINFTAGEQKIGNISVQTLDALNFDIFTFTKEGMATGGTRSRFFNVGRNNTTFGSDNWDSPGFLINGNIVRRTNTGSDITEFNVNPKFSTTIPSISYHTFTDVNFSRGLNGAANGTSLTHTARGLMTGGHIFGDTRNPGTGGDDAGFIGHIGETIVYGSGNLTAVERRRVDSYLAIKYGITLGRVATEHYLGSTASPTSIVWNGSNASYNNNIFGLTRSDIGGFEQKVSKSVNSGTILTIANDKNFVSSNTDSSRTTFSEDETYLLFGDNLQSGQKSLATDPCTGQPLNPPVSSANRVWRVQATGNQDPIWVEADLNAYTFNSNIEMWIADDEGFTTNLVKSPAASFASGIATFNHIFPEGVKYVTFAGIVTPVDCDVCTGGTFSFKTGRSWNTSAERISNTMSPETIGATDQGNLIVAMNVNFPAGTEYGANSNPRPYGRWFLSRRYDNQNVTVTNNINLNQTVAGASFQISNINTFLANANKFTVIGYDCDNNPVLPKITHAATPNASTTYIINGNEVVGTKPYRGLTFLQSTANVRFSRPIERIQILFDVQRVNARRTLRSLDIGDISFECAVPLPPTLDNVTMVQDFTQSEDVPSCIETTMRMRLINNNCNTRTIDISQTLPVGLEFVPDTYNDSEFSSAPAFTFNPSTFSLNGLQLPSGTNFLYINVRSTAGSTTSYATNSSFTVSETGNTYNSIDPAGNTDSRVGFVASNFTAPDLDLQYSVDRGCLNKGGVATYTLSFDNQGPQISGATLKVYYDLGQEITAVNFNNGISGVDLISPIGESYIEMEDMNIPNGQSSIEVVINTNNDIYTDETFVASFFELIVEPGNPCAEDQPMVSNAVELNVCDRVIISNPILINKVK